MTWLSRLRRRREDDGLEREIDAHLAERVDDLVERGVPAAEARRRAHVEFGNRTRYIEDSRGVRRLAWLDSLAQDVRFALRMLGRQPSYVLGTILVLSIAIGLVTALFAVFNATVLRPWPVPDPASIVIIRGRPLPGQQYGTLSNVEYRYFRERARSFTHMASTMPGGGSIGRDEGVALADVQWNFVSANYFDTLGIGMAAGRTFLREEEDYVSPRPVAIISERVWREYFDGDPAIAGRTIRVRNRPRTIVGVAAAGFADVWGVRIDVWMPLPTAALAFTESLDRDTLARFADPRVGGPRVIGRLAPGVDATRAQAELDVLNRQFRRAVGMDAPGMILTDTRPIHSASAATTQDLPILGLMFVALLLILLLACANVANLNLARAMGRRREVATRISLGASRLRVARQLLTESAIVCLIAGAAGFCLAATVPQALMRSANPIRRPDMLDADLAVFAFALGTTALACLLSGAAPAFRATRTNLATSGLDRFAGGAGATRLRGVLLASQIALTTTLLVGAGLLTRAIGYAMSVDPGFAVSDVQLVSLETPLRTPPAALRQLVGALQREDLPVAAADFPPITSSRADVSVRHSGQGLEMSRLVLLRPVSSNYFETLGIRMVAGRTFSASPDHREIVVSESAARRFWPDRPAIGQRLSSGGVGSRPEMSHEVVGVAADVATTKLTAVEPVIYWSTDAPRVLLTRDRSASAAERIAGVVRATVTGAAISGRPLLEDVRRSLQDLVIGSRVAWMLGGLALALATVGAFAVFAYLVEERRREIGIRMALGARAGQVVRLVLGAAGRPIAAGLAIGLLLSIAGARLLRSALYGMSPFDPIAYLQIAAILGAAGALATWIPARRATRIDPAVTLRAD
jgi:putative ABC transport system permease protein